MVRGSALLLTVLLLMAACGGESETPVAEEPTATDDAATVDDEGAEGVGGTEGEEAAADDVTVGFVYVGPVGDVGWTYTHDQGRRALEDELDGVATLAVEDAGAEEDARRALIEFAEAGADFVFVTSVSLNEVALEIGAEYDLAMSVASGYATGPTVGNYVASTHEGFYLSGLVAGSMTESNQVGYVTSFPFPEFLRDINAFAVGVREVNPDATVRLVWTGTFFDPPVERDAALALIDGGADVVAQEQDSPAVVQAAEERGVYAISSNTDLTEFGPSAVLTGPTYHWGPFYARTIEEVQSGTWDPDEVRYLGIAEETIGLAPFSDAVPEDVVTLVEQRMAEIAAGEFDIFSGPIEDQDGEVRIPEGETWGPERTAEFDFLLDNVQGSPTG